MDTYQELAYCGIYCRTCSNYRQNENCLGCRDEPKLLWDCPLRICAQAKGLVHCGLCDEYPCAELSSFYAEDRESHKKAQSNMQAIIDLGVDAWLAQQTI